MINTARVLCGARRVLDACRLVSEAGCSRLAHTAAASRYDIQPSVRPGVGVLTWLLQSNLTAAERRALAAELDPLRAHVQPVAGAVLSPVTQPAAPKVQPVQQQQKQEVAVPVPVAVAARAVEHPVLGALLYDFGYKRVYAMPAASLVDASITPVWQQQRSFRLERAEAIAKVKSKDASVGLPGVISLYELGGGSFRAIIDGQHRVGALRLLLRGAGGASSQWSRVLVEVFPLQNESQAEQLFCEINSAQPVQSVDLPASAGGADAADKAVLEGAVKLLAQQHAAMFKPSVNAKPPHVNMDRLRDLLFQRDVMAAHGLDSTQQLHAWLTAHNERLRALSDAEWTGRRPAKRSAALDASFVKALAKAREHGFFLGLDWLWLDE